MQRDLLASDDAGARFRGGDARRRPRALRFGDDTHGRRPRGSTPRFKAIYRKGNGAAGNVGAESIRTPVAHAALAIESITNPLPAFGGVDAEDIEARAAMRRRRSARRSAR